MAVRVVEAFGVDVASSSATSYFLLARRPEGGLLAGLWEFPAVVAGAYTPPLVGPT